MIATCGKICVAEVEELVPVSSIDPDGVHVPGIYVDRIIQGAKYEKRIEFRTVAGVVGGKGKSPIPAWRWRSAQRRSCRDGFLREPRHRHSRRMVANYIPDGVSVTLQSENGLLGIGPFPSEDNIDPDLINAGKQTITSLRGSSYFSSAESFAMIRGGHIDLSILGGTRSLRAR